MDFFWATKISANKNVFCLASCTYILFDKGRLAKARELFKKNKHIVYCILNLQFSDNRRIFEDIFTKSLDFVVF